MAGVKVLRHLALGKEATPGVIVSATTIWRGTGTLEDQRAVTFPREDIGYVSGHDRAYTPQLLAALAMEDTPATFEQLPFLFEASIKAVGTGTPDGTGSSGFQFVYPFPTNTRPTIRTFTIEGGDDEQAEVAEYCHVADWHLTGKGGMALMVGANWRGRQVVVQAFTPSPEIPTIEDILFLNGRVWIDPINGAAGTSLLSQTILDVKLDYKSGWEPVFTADGSLFYSFIQIGEPELVATVTFEHDTFGVARKVDWRARVPRILRFQWDGASYATPGTGTLNSGKKTLRIDCAAKVSKVSKLGEQNGNNVLTVVFRSRFNPTYGAMGTVTVTNELSAVVEVYLVTESGDSLVTDAGDFIMGN